LVVWWFCLLILVGVLFYAVNFWFYGLWFYLLFIGPTEICVWTMIFSWDLQFLLASYFIMWVTGFQMTSEKGVIRTWSWCSLTVLRTNSVEQESSGFHRQTSGNILKHNFFQESE
jgi:hypothetical protein